ncbi:MAG: arylcarboxylate reductase [Alphaproteobacteria bacterium]|nr:arylcarboxylate reductase [Alphaproteobacteria bacterium]
MLIPALIGRGPAGYATLDRHQLIGLDGTRLGEASVTPPVIIHALAERMSTALRDVPIRTLLATFARAADIFADGEPDGLTPEAFVRNVALSSGLPLSVSRDRTLGFFPDAMRRMDRFLDVQSPAGLDPFDSNMCTIAGVPLALIPRGGNVGFIMPGNHPAPHFMWLGALAMKVPVVLRPSMDDLFTPYRLVRSLLAAGLPDDVIAFVPGGHDLVDSIVQACSNSVLFGGQQIADRYASNDRVRIHGPGRSKVVVLANADFDKSVALIQRAVLDDAGRSCVNVSAVIVEGDARRLAAAVAASLDEVPIEAPLSAHAVLGATASAQAAVFGGIIDRHLTGGARELTAGRNNRTVTVEGMTIMRPTVIELASFEHPLFGIELPFPFVVFASAPPQHLVRAASGSLAVIVAGEDSGFTRELLLDPTIDKVLAQDAVSTQFDPLEPHEGFLFDFLYMKKTFRLCRACPAGERK